MCTYHVVILSGDKPGAVHVVGILRKAERLDSVGSDEVHTTRWTCGLILLSGRFMLLKLGMGATVHSEMQNTIVIKDSYGECRANFCLVAMMCIICKNIYMNLY